MTAFLKMRIAGPDNVAYHGLDASLPHDTPLISADYRHCVRSHHRRFLDTARPPNIDFGLRDRRGNNRGVREFIAGHTFEAAAGIGTFSTPNGTSNVLSLSYDGLGDGASFSGVFPPVDLTDGGLADRFIFSVTDLFSAGTAFPAVFLTVNLVDADSNSVAIPSILVLSAPGAVTAPLPTSGIDLTRITALSIPMFFSTQPLNEFSFSLDHICTGNSSGCTSSPAAVPEPTSLALLGMGLGAVALCRRRKVN